MSNNVIHSFYCSKAFTDLAIKCKIKSGGVCNSCGKVFDISDLRAHHIKELTLSNIDDVNVTLNEDNIEVLCHECHNRRHHRFGGGHTEKRVYLVYGSPCSGKTTYVRNIATRNDLVVDLDRIHQSICICDIYDKPDATKSVAFNIRDLLLDEIRLATPRRRWDDAYIIGGYPDKYDRLRMVEQYGASLIHIDTPKEECIKRAMESVERDSVKRFVVEWINKYWERYSE